jgi:hypothetical protein
MAIVRPSLLVAAGEGRLYPPLAEELGVETGVHRCQTCGMLGWTLEESERCCVIGAYRVYEKTPRTGAVAEIVDRDRFHAGVLARVEYLGLTSIAAMAREYGCDRSFLAQLHVGNRRYLNATNWARLVSMFGGPPPGFSVCGAPPEGER